MKKIQKGVSKIFLLIIIFVIIVISAIIFGYDNNGVREMQSDIQTKAQDVISEGSEVVVEKVIDESKEVVGKKLKKTGENMLGEKIEPGVYGEYGDEDVEGFENKILFFTAPWCPSCTEVHENIIEEQKEIPADVAIIRVDFDNDVQLREKYGVDKQHTFILIDENGEEISRWNNSKTLKEIIENIK